MEDKTYANHEAEIIILGEFHTRLIACDEEIPGRVLLDRVSRE